MNCLQACFDDGLSRRVSGWGRWYWRQRSPWDVDHASKIAVTGRVPEIKWTRGSGDVVESFKSAWTVLLCSWSMLDLSAGDRTKQLIFSFLHMAPGHVYDKTKIEGTIKCIFIISQLLVDKRILNIKRQDPKLETPQKNNSLILIQ